MPGRLSLALVDLDRCEGALAVVGALAMAATALALLAPGFRTALGRRLTFAGPRPDAESAVVAHVVDGDTFITSGGATVRIVGVDTPETVNPNLSHPQAYGPEASERLRELVEGREVLLERDSKDVDHYGRLLRHVWRRGALVAEVLVSEGLGTASAISPNLRHAERLARAEARARRESRGLWSLPRPTSIDVFGRP